ncbi:urease accessory protein UreE [Spiribacter pallidus]|jgi:urease accessory protein|uniref:urease accessory protein UreE n=2 Tax=Spiribacter pallidus TaxID=1987936 RepID=UPI0038B2BCD7
MMIALTQRLDDLDNETTIAGALVLTIAQRERTRFRATLDNGQTVVVQLPRGGSVLRPGDYLGDGEGFVVRVEAALESVSTATHPDPWKLLQAAYHLGNRHTPLEIGAGYLRYHHDHVLDGMVEGLGLVVVHENAPFQPESGAYSHGSPDHGSSHGHGHHHASGGVYALD